MYVEASHLAEITLGWVEWNKTIRESRKTIKGYIGMELLYDDFVSPHKPHEVPPHQKYLVDAIVKLNKNIEDKLSTATYDPTLPNVWTIKKDVYK